MAQQEKLIDQMEARLKLNLVEAINQFATTYEEPEPSPSTTKNDTSTELTSALSTITGNSNKQTDQMMKMFQDLSKKIDTLAPQQTQQNVKFVTENPNKKVNAINPKTGQPWRRYCWTHGCCDHWSNKCPQRKSGHQLNATFKNRMGGSTDGVLGIN